MKVAVLLKTATGGAVNADDAFARSARTLSGVLGPYDAHALEEALCLREQGIAQELVAFAIAASSDVLGGLREALSMGADRAILVADPLVEHLDVLGLSRIVAALLAREAADLGLYCPWSGDIDGTLLWTATAERLGRPVLCQARRLNIVGTSVETERQTEIGDVTLSAELPCLVEVAETINKARRATIKGRAAAKAKPLAVLNLSQLGLATPVGASTSILSIAFPKPTRNPIRIDGTEDAASRIVAFLNERSLLS